MSTYTERASDIKQQIHIDPIHLSDQLLCSINMALFDRVSNKDRLTIDKHTWEPIFLFFRREIRFHIVKYSYAS
jgi:hypothetical protein